MKKIGKLSLLGDSDEEYAFDVYPHNTEFKDQPAVYCYTNRYQKDGKWKHKVVYIGHTDDLSTEFYEHPHHDCLQKHSANCIGIHMQEAEKERIAIHHDLVAQYDPSCNGYTVN